MLGAYSNFLDTVSWREGGEIAQGPSIFPVAFQKVGWYTFPVGNQNGVCLE